MQGISGVDEPIASSGCYDPCSTEDPESLLRGLEDLYDPSLFPPITEYAAPSEDNQGNKQYETVGIVTSDEESLTVSSSSLIEELGQWMEDELPRTNDIDNEGKSKLECPTQLLSTNEQEKHFETRLCARTELMFEGMEKLYDPSIELAPSCTTDNNCASTMTKFSRHAQQTRSESAEKNSFESPVASIEAQQFISNCDNNQLNDQCNMYGVMSFDELHWERSRSIYNSITDQLDQWMHIELEESLQNDMADDNYTTEPTVL